MLSNDKITAIYDLRAAVEAKVHAEHALELVPSPEGRAALLDATLEVEAKTQNAIDVCHECGHAHESGASHGNNVVEVDFSADPRRGRDES
jgi:hypothetical protein